MTNKPMLSVERESVRELWVMLSNDSSVEDDSVYGDIREELRALLDKPVLESQYDGMTQVQAQSVSDGVDEILHGKPAAQRQPEPVMSGYDLDRIESALDGLDPDEYCEGVDVHDIGTLLQAVRTLQVRQILAAPEGQHAPVAVVMPDDREDQLFDEMSRRFDLRKQIDDDHMVYDDTQVGVEFARDWIKARLNGVKP